LVEVPIPAQAAVEFMLRDLLTSILIQHISKKNARELLVKSLTFNQQLNSLYPLILGLLRLPPLPEDIRAGVNSLATARNDIAHGEPKERELSFDEVANGLTAILFAFKHICHVQEVVAETTPPSPPTP
jgi:hypothetical protein